MRKILPALTAALSLALAGSALAVPPAGTGGGYYGSAWFDSDQGIVVHGATYSECAQALQYSINYRVNHWGWTVTELNPCSYRPPFAHVGVLDELKVEIRADSPEGSLDQANAVLGQIARLRRTHAIDAYEADLGKLLTAGSGRR
ncbi:hypothetical protein [Pseudomarimonas arenosa]|uniref:Uncharacterized protein n=1 Tax=Pseudomarimonas arenosa TaxID=2774145 RepID=A0AAW3ZTQ7_9GAMM|nr:hypothetical protein [Pseudomarimonas arenosa]MBD8527894.1 hypothetical protein [Pseudomarimonas arenosa]